MSKHYDYIAIGGGSGGIASVNRAAMYGKKCALIEMGLLEDACSTEKILYRNFLFGVVISISGHFFRNSGCS